MILVALAELIIAVLLVYLGYAQIIIPLWRNTPLFPMFRRAGRLQHELTKATERVAEADLEREIAETAAKAELIRQTAHPSTRPAPGPGKNVNQ